MARRTGIPTLLHLLGLLLIALAKFVYVILDLFPDDTELAVALASLQVAAAEAQRVLQAKRDYGD